MNVPLSKKKPVKMRQKGVDMLSEIQKSRFVSGSFITTHLGPLPIEVLRGVPVTYPPLIIQIEGSAQNAVAPGSTPGGGNIFLQIAALLCRLAY